jgi:hypothetical protein
VYTLESTIMFCVHSMNLAPSRRVARQSQKKPHVFPGCVTRLYIKNFHSFLLLRGVLLCVACVCNAVYSCWMEFWIVFIFWLLKPL